MKAFVDEPGREDVIAALDEATVAAVSWIGFVECRSALAGARREGRLDASGEGRASRLLEETWSQLAIVEIDDALASEAATLAGEHPLRAADAIHLASAGVLSGDEPGSVLFACWDIRLRDAAAELGFPVLPAPRA